MNKSFLNYSNPLLTVMLLSETPGPAINAIKNRVLFDQIFWERCVAISQLEDIGLSLGEKTDKVKEALEKQIPKKPLFGTVHNDTAYYCSSCKNFIGFYDTRIYEYCHNCGQKLDWGE